MEGGKKVLWNSLGWTMELLEGYSVHEWSVSGHAVRLGRVGVGMQVCRSVMCMWAWVCEGIDMWIGSTVNSAGSATYMKQAHGFDDT
jgi:hypothetical protein